MKLIRSALLVLASVVAGLFVFEIGTRAYDSFTGHGFFSDWRNPLTSTGPKFRPFRIFGPDLYAFRDGKRMISSRYHELYPYEKPTGTFRIVVFGGSTSENLQTYKAEGFHYPLILQQILRKELKREDIEVINVANSAYATPHSLIELMLDVLSWQPDLVIMSHNVNDLLVAYWKDFVPDYSSKFKHAYYRLPDLANLYTPLNIIFQKSQFYWVIRDSINKLFPEPTKPLQRKSYGMSPPAEALETFKRNLRSFIAIARTRGIRVLFGTQAIMPTKEMFELHMREKVYNDEVIYPLHEEFVAHHSAYNKAIIEVAKENDIYYVDNEPSMSGVAKYFIDFVHYTPEGVRQLARNYATYILQNNIIGPAPTASNAPSGN
jgi:hypothetical protein